MAERNAATPSYADVSAALALCTYGDTLNIPEGSGSWGTNYLTTSKDVLIKGAGKALTTISFTGEHVVLYTPDSTSGARDERFEVSGMKFDGGYTDISGEYAVAIENAVGYPASGFETSRVVIKDINFHNCVRGIGLSGSIFGVATGCTIEYGTGAGREMIFLQALGSERESWWNHPLTVGCPFGHSKNFYIEDCTFDGEVWMESGHGGRYAVRHCAFNNLLGYALFDNHGNQDGGLYAAILSEYYDNTVDMGINHSLGLIDNRGGSTLAYNNTVTGAGDQVQYSYMNVTDESDGQPDGLAACRMGSRCVPSRLMPGTTRRTGTILDGMRIMTPATIRPLRGMRRLGRSLEIRPTGTTSTRTE